MEEEEEQEEQEQEQEEKEDTIQRKLKKKRPGVSSQGIQIFL